MLRFLDENIVPIIFVLTLFVVLSFRTITNSSNNEFSKFAIKNGYVECIKEGHKLWKKQCKGETNESNTTREWQMEDRRDRR